MILCTRGQDKKYDRKSFLKGLKKKSNGNKTIETLKLIANHDWTISNVDTMMKKTTRIVFPFISSSSDSTNTEPIKFCCVHVGMPNKRADKHAINCGRVVGGGRWCSTRGRKPTADVVTIFYTSSNNVTSSLPGPSVNIKWSNLSFGQRRESDDDSDVRLARPICMCIVLYGSIFAYVWKRVYIISSTA